LATNFLLFFVANSVSGSPVCRLREDSSLNLRTYREWQYQMLCSTILPPDDEHNSAWNVFIFIFEEYNKLIIKQEFVH
jgi:hypothetical protein